MYVDESSIGRNPTVDYLVSDISGNTAVCKSQLRIEGRLFNSQEHLFINICLLGQAINMSD